MTTYEEYTDYLHNNRWYAHADQNDTGELAYHALGLAGEGGEFVDLVKKIVRDHGYTTGMHEMTSELRARLKDELGDVFWYFTQLCTMLEVTHNELMELNMYKLRKRDAAGERQHVQ